MRSRILAIVLMVVLTPAALQAGGPAFVAGAGYNPGVEGQPLVWANASVQYFTDQGNLSPILSGAQADAFVATAISAWVLAPGVSLTVSQAGHLAEDVNGSNIQVAPQGVITAPADITPAATGTPLGIVYDYDGTVTDAILGQGAGDVDECFTNAVYGGPDNFSAAGNLIHAVVIINGVCASTSAQLTDVQYRLVRVLGRIFGLGWSQANLNVQTQDPPPTQADFAGFPVMHFQDVISCVPITSCYPNAAVPKLDDVTALARLYPAPGGNPLATGRIYGNVYFTDSSGNAEQPMQGVNVVARLMVDGEPSRQYVVTSPSGSLFCGNAGNIVTGYVDPNGLPFDRWGSGDVSLEGFYDLGELIVPSGNTSAEYQLSVEPLDPFWSLGVESYAPTQVTPSGNFAPVMVTVASGSNSERDILMLGSETAETHPGSGSSYANPAALPQGGRWGSWISGYGSTDWFEFTAQANRSASVSVTALDESGEPTESKLLPIVGIWELSDQTQNPAPAATASAFNVAVYGESRLDAGFTSTEAYRVGIVDYRGDGRPDYSYQASVLYSDTATPWRLSLAGGITTLEGIGFVPGQQVAFNASNGNILSQSATQMQVSAPAAAFDGPVTIQVTDPATGGFSQMVDALTLGAAASDQLLLLQGSEPSTPVGSQAANPIRVRAIASDGVTPVNGATIAWSSTNGVTFSACAGAESCSVLTDEAGEAFTWVAATATGPGTITAALAPLSYSPASTEQATLVGASTSLDLAALVPSRFIAQGATVAVPLTVEVLNMGMPIPNVVVSYTMTSGIATLSAGTATTNNSGFASVNAQVTNLGSQVNVSACVSPGNNPCQTFSLFSVAPSSWKLETVSGAQQAVPNGGSFQPLVIRVTDGSTADDPVLGAPVIFITTLERNPQGPGPGGSQPGNDARPADGMPVILGTSQTQLVTDQNGLASITPTVGDVGPCDVFIIASAGGASVQVGLENLDPITIEQQPNRGKARPLQSVMHFRAMPSEVQTPTTPTELFAVPQAIPSADSPGAEPAGADATPTDAPPTETPPSACHDPIEDVGVAMTSTVLAAPPTDGAVAPASGTRSCASQEQREGRECAPSLRNSISSSTDPPSR